MIIKQFNLFYAAHTITILLVISSALSRGILEIAPPLLVWRIARQGDASSSTLSNRVWILWGLILITMENYSDSDTSSKSEFESNQGSAAQSDCDEDEDEPNQHLKPEPSEFYNKYESDL